MKSYPLTALNDDVWKQIDFIFWRNEVSCLPDGSAGDGFIPVSLETSKHGVEIRGTMTFLGGKTGVFEHPMSLCLSRPNFSSLESVTPERVREVVIEEAYFDGKDLIVTVS